LWPAVTRAHVVTAVGLSAQPPADRSVQRLRQCCRWTAPADCWATRRRSGPPSARQRARTDAAPCLTSSPPKGQRRKAPAPLRSARATGSCHPPSPSRGLCSEALRVRWAPPSRFSRGRLALAAGGAHSRVMPPAHPAPSPSSHSSRKPRAACVRCGRCQRSRLPPQGAPRSQNSSPARRDKSVAARRARAVKAALATLGAPRP
jgi:hypothetical protein